MPSQRVPASTKSPNSCVNAIPFRETRPGISLRYDNAAHMSSLKTIWVVTFLVQAEESNLYVLIGNQPNAQILAGAQGVEPCVSLSWIPPSFKPL